MTLITLLDWAENKTGGSKERRKGQVDKSECYTRLICLNGDCDCDCKRKRKEVMMVVLVVVLVVVGVSLSGESSGPESRQSVA